VIEVELTRSQYQMAVNYACSIDGRYDGKRDRTDPGRTRSRGYSQRIESTAAEFALAKYLELPIEIRFVSGKGDVGDYEVRWTPEHGYRLIVRPDDPPDLRYVLITGTHGCLPPAGLALRLRGPARAGMARGSQRPTPRLLRSSVGPASDRDAGLVGGRTRAGGETVLVVVALSSAEQNYLVRLLQRELAEHEEPLAPDLLKMLESALEPGLVGSLGRELRA